MDLSVKGRATKGGSRIQSHDAGPNPMATVRVEPRRAPSSRLAPVLCVGLAAAACSSSPRVLPNVKGPAEELPRAEVYFPLHDGYIYQYTVVGQDGRPAFLITKVGRDDDTATLTSGDRVQHLTIRNDGVYNEAGYYVVLAPMSKGLEWNGQSGLVRVIEVGKRVETGAGKFTDCAVTSESTQGTVEIRTVEMTFCPNVGLVELNVRAESDRVTAVERATLEYFGPPIDVDAL